MNVLARHPRPPRRWWLAGFTLIELVVVIVIIAILLGMIALGYNRFTARAYDTATAENLRGMTKSLVVDLQAREGSTYSMEGIEAVATKVPPLVATGTPGHLTVTTGAATVSALSVAIDPDDAGKVGLALKSPTGKCVLAQLDGVDATVSKPLDGATCTGGTAKDAEDLDDPGADPDAPEEDAQDPDDLDDGFTGTLLAPRTVTATPGIPESTDASVTWDAVEGAKAYEVYLDAVTEPAVTVKTTTAVLEALTEGSHSVTVRATRGTGENLVRGPGRSSTSFTVKYLENDMFALARKIAMPEQGKNITYSGSNANATLEAGEAGGYRSLWWKYTPTETASYGFFVSSAGTNLRISTGTTAASPGDVEDINVSSSLMKGYLFRAGTTYYIRIAAQANTVMTYSFRVEHSPANDLIANATEIVPPAPGKSWDTGNANLSNNFATIEPGESGDVTRSLWWKITPPRDGSYGFQVSNYPTSLRIGTSKDVLVRGEVAEVTSATSNINHAVVLRGGTTYYIRVASVGDKGQLFKLTVTGGPANDLVQYADVIDPPAPGEARTFTVVNQNATLEPGETGAGLLTSLWWKMTPTRTGPYVFTGSAFASSLRIGTSNNVAVTGDIADFVGKRSFNEAYTLRAGTTYFIRVGVSDQTVTAGTLRVSGGALNDDVADAQDVGPLAPGASRVFPVNSTNATMQPGELVGGSLKLTQSLWWKFTPDRTGSYGFRVDSTGNRKYFRIGTSPDPAAAGNVANDVALDWTYSGSGLAYILQGGTTYYIRVAHQVGEDPAYTLTVKGGPLNALSAHPEPIALPGIGEKIVYKADLSAAALEPGEVGGDSSVWWKVTPTRDGTYEFTADSSTATARYLRVSTTANPTIKGDVFDAQLGSYARIDLKAGPTYYIRVAGSRAMYPSYVLTITGK